MSSKCSGVLLLDEMLSIHDDAVDDEADVKDGNDTATSKHP